MYRLIGNFGENDHYDESVIQFTYEEMVELLAAGKRSTIGNEALASMKQKASAAFDRLPKTDY